MTRKTFSADHRTKTLFQKLSSLTRKMSSRAVPEAVHQLRTTVRRIETLITTHGLAEQRGLGKLLKQLAALRRRAGKVRDLDVQLAALRSIHLESGGSDKTALVRHLARIRAKREKKLLAALKQAEDNSLQKRLQRGTERLLGEAQIGPGRNFTAEALQKFRKLVDAHPPLTESNLHEFRMDCKRIRYLAEIGETPEAQRIMAALKRIQDAIGEWHDWVTLTEVAEELITTPASPLLGSLRAHCRSKFNEALRVVDDATRQTGAGVMTITASSRKHPASATAATTSANAAAG